MLSITIPAAEYYDEYNEVFVHVPEQKLQLEHSLVSVSKWEQKWHKPFLTKDKKTREENIDYVRCMTLTQNVDPRVYVGITDRIMEEIMAYIDDPMTATWFPEEKNQKANREVITNEIIYYWMIALDIPPDYQKWHLNRLITLIRVCNAKNKPAKKMSRKDILAQNRAVNEARRKALGTRG
jgi:hypothetical protein